MPAANARKMGNTSLIDRIQNPADLRKLALDELKTLSSEIRQRIIEVVSVRGGHLSSSLGAVELCIALHYCLNTPEDRIVFDVGHQAYAHKIITGRNRQFSRLREYGGISGFPNCFESEYDTCCPGHSSDAVSLALGLAEARRLRGTKERIAAVIGDGSLTGGMCFEALNQAGHLGTDILVVLNHNEMSIAASVGALSSYLNKIMSLPIYNRIRGEIVQFLAKSAMGEKIAPHLRKLEEVIKGIVVPGIFFEELGFRYFGPFDGHNLDTLVPALKNILEIKGPKMLHVVTKKGKGWRFAEESPERFHSAPPFDVSTGTFVVKKDAPAEETFTAVFSRKIAEIGERNPAVVTLTAAMPLGTGLHLFQQRFPGRFFDVGIAEAHAAGFAAGLSQRGLKVFVAIYSTFLPRAYDQLMQNISLPQNSVVFVLDRAGIVPDDGPTHQGIFDIAYLRTIPGCVIMAPKGKEELEQMLDFSVGCASPCFIRFPKDTAKSFSANAPLRFKQSEVLAEGEDVCIIAAGTMCVQALEARERLAGEHVSVGVMNPRFLKPFDEESILACAQRCRTFVTIEDGIVEGGFGQAVLGFLNRRGLLSKVRVLTIGLPTEPVSVGKRDVLFKKYGLDTESLCRTIKKFLGQPKTYEQAAY